MDLEDQVLVVLVSPTAPDDASDVAVDRFDDSETDTMLAVFDDPDEVPFEGPDELLKRGKALPANRLLPSEEEVHGRALVAVGPESFDALLEVVPRGQAAR